MKVLTMMRKIILLYVLSLAMLQLGFLTPTANADFSCHAGCVTCEDNLPACDPRMLTPGACLVWDDPPGDPNGEHGCTYFNYAPGCNGEMDG